eukprot:14224.XXX_611080_611217_1 [CDS] Oithona nana genome sequencing.
MKNWMIFWFIPFNFFFVMISQIWGEVWITGIKQKISILQKITHSG